EERIPRLASAADRARVAIHRADVFVGCSREEGNRAEIAQQIRPRHKPAALSVDRQVRLALTLILRETVVPGRVIEVVRSILEPRRPLGAVRRKNPDRAHFPLTSERVGLRKSSSAAITLPGSCRTLRRRSTAGTVSTTIQASSRNERCSTYQTSSAS